jgi:hypothetical protein
MNKSSVQKTGNHSTAPRVITTTDKEASRLSPIAEKLIAAVEAELGDGFTARHKINQAAKSFPYNHRTMANRDALKTGPKEKILIGKHIFYNNQSVLDMLRADLSK